MMAIIFQSTPPVKAATQLNKIIGGVGAFQTTPPVKAATFIGYIRGCNIKFQSTPPVKAATFPFLLFYSRLPYFNPRRP